MAQMLKSALSNIIPDEHLSDVCSSFDIIGNKIIIKIPDSLLSYKHIISEILLRKIKCANAVFLQTSPVKGEYRIRNIQCIAGDSSYIAEYKEHGCRFKIDLQNTYFSPRLSTERIRIANMVKENEIVINMFGGVGTFSIIIAKKKVCKVINIDSNPVAIECCKENAVLNKISDRVISVLGDAKEVICKDYLDFADRILMPLPEHAKDYVDIAVKALKNQEGIIHYFSHIQAANKRDALLKSRTDAENAFYKYNFSNIHSQMVREVGPRVYQIVSDVKISRKQGPSKY